MTAPDKNSITNTSLSHIDIGKNLITEIPVDFKNNELEVYLETLLVEINEKEEKRIFSTPTSTTTFSNAISKFATLDKPKIQQASNTLAQRLLEKEAHIAERYGHLSKKNDIHVKIGSFLQFIYTEKGQLRYLGVKVDHQIILDEQDFKTKAGLGLSEKIYKAVKVEYNKENLPSRISIFDTKPKLTKYWWHDFLELVESNTDEFNTGKAVDETIKAINTIKSKFPQDHTILRNATIAAFRQKGQMNYHQFIQTTFENYTSDAPEFEEAKIKLIAKLKTLPEKKGFDPIFNTIPSAVPFNKTTYKLTAEISLSIKDGIANLSEKIWSEETNDGRELIVIESSEAKKFERKQRKP